MSGPLAPDPEAADFSEVELLSFDCYGTLIDWETGILEALSDLFRRHGRDRPPAEALLARYAAHESAAEHGPWVPYREVLARVGEGLAADHDLGLAPGDRDFLAESLPDWPPFADTVPSLRALAARFRLAVVSNVDEALFARTQASLGVDFDFVITAEATRSYKPDRAIFDEASRRFALARARHLHCAQSLWHDVAPARAAGWRTVWVDRRGGRSGGATPDSDARPERRVGSLAELARALGVTP
ncbi:MAG: haloacid dehalogenase type II [Gemmatimonadetes bacterium]|nr:haloacid dehalogenase type II [Gemmatimonadota bacterium]